jgi:predicted dehydrogenase
MAEHCVVVGAGGISNSWFPPLKEEEVEVAAVVDVRPEAARQQIAKYELGAEASSDLELYMVSQSRRWEPKHDAVRRTIAGGAIGDVTTVNCDFFLGAHFGGFRDEMPSPLILDMAIHHFDLARFMSGADPVAVYAHEFNPKGSWYRGDVSADCIFEMTGGVVFAYRGSWCSEGFPTSWNGQWRIIGERGTLLYEYDQEPRVQVAAGDEGFMRPLQDVPPAPSPIEKKYFHGGLMEMLTFLRTGEKPQTECHDNIKSLAMVFAAIESSHRKERVEVRGL